MAFTTPRTYVAGEIHLAAHHNTYERDNIAWLATDSPQCRAYNNANISIAVSATIQSLTFNSERFDNAAVHSTGVSTGRLTVPAGGGGKYVIGSQMEFAANVTGDRGNYIWQNGTTYLAVQQQLAGTRTANPNLVTIASLSAADYVEARAFQESGGALNVLSTANYSPEFWCLWTRT